MSKIFLDRDNNVVYEGYETHEVVANPTLAGTEDNLTGLKIGDTKYKVFSGGATYTAGNGIEINNDEISVDSEVVQTTFYANKSIDKLTNKDIEPLKVGDFINDKRGSYYEVIENTGGGILLSNTSFEDTYNISYVNINDEWTFENAYLSPKFIIVYTNASEDEMCMTLLSCSNGGTIIVKDYNDDTDISTTSIGNLEYIEPLEEGDPNFKLYTNSLIIYFYRDDSGDKPIVTNYTIERITPPTVDDYMLKVNLTYSSSAGEYITDYTLQEIYNAASSGKMVYIYCVNYSNQYGQNTTFNIIKDAEIRLDPHGEADVTYNFNLIYVVDKDNPDDAGIIFDYDNQKFTYFFTPIN